MIKEGSIAEYCLEVALGKIEGKTLMAFWNSLEPYTIWDVLNRWESGV